MKIVLLLLVGIMVIGCAAEPLEEEKKKPCEVDSIEFHIDADSIVTN